MNVLACFFLCLFVLQLLDFFFYSVGGEGNGKNEGNNLRARAQYRGEYQLAELVERTHDVAATTSTDDGDDHGAKKNRNSDIFKGAPASTFSSRMAANVVETSTARMDVTYKKSLVSGMVDAELRFMFHSPGANRLRTIGALNGVLPGAAFKNVEKDAEDIHVLPAFGKIVDPEQPVVFVGTVPRSEFFEPPDGLVEHLWMTLKHGVGLSSPPAADSATKDEQHVNHDVDSAGSSGGAAGGQQHHADSSTPPGTAGGGPRPTSDRSTCSFEFRLYPADQTGGDRHTSQTKTSHGVLISHDCSVHAKLLLRQVDETKNADKSWNVAFFLNVLTLFEMTVYARQITDLQHAEQIFLPNVLLLALYTMVETFLYLVFSARGLPSNAEVFNNFCVVIFLKFLLFASMQMRLVLILFRKQVLARVNNRTNNDNDLDAFANEERQMRREIAILYWRFYTVMLLTIFCVNFTFIDFYHWYLLAITGLTWTPQIVWNVRHGYRNAFQWNFLSRVSVLKLLPLLYQYSCPYNIFTGEVLPKLSADLHSPAPPTNFCDPNWRKTQQLPEDRGSWNPMLGMAFVALHAGQLAVLWTQRKWGARWFVPWMCLPHVYNYHRAPPKDAFPDLELGDLDPDPIGARAQGQDSPLDEDYTTPVVDPTAVPASRSPHKHPGAAPIPPPGTPSATAQAGRPVLISGSAAAVASSSSSMPPGGPGGVELQVQPPMSPTSASASSPSRVPRAAPPARPIREPNRYDCVICMDTLDFREMGEQRPVCAPCHHWFHQNCLEEWMKVKMECPTCRKPLPPLEV